MAKRHINIVLIFLLVFAGCLCNANAHAGKSKKNRYHKDVFEQHVFGKKTGNSTEKENVRQNTTCNDSVQQLSFPCLKLRQSADFFSENSFGSFHFGSTEKLISKENISSRPNFIEQKSLLFCYPFLAFW